MNIISLIDKDSYLDKQNGSFYLSWLDIKKELNSLTSLKQNDSFFYLFGCISTKKLAL